MKLIVGLGNPGKRYEITRHNVGFIIIDILSKKLNVALEQHKFDGAFVKLQEHNVILLKPLTYMNLSGDCVASFINYFKIKPEDVLIIHDEVDLPFGRIQFKNSGSAAGHNGLKDILAKTKQKDFMRFRIGVGRSEQITTADWVLSNFTYSELNLIHQHEKFFVDAILMWLHGASNIELMNKFNKQQF